MRGLEKNEISIQQVRIFRFVRDAKTWVTGKQITEAAKCSGRTQRQHTLNLVNLGIFDQVELFPGHRYRMAEKAEQRNKSYLLRLEKASEVFGEE